jgi:hypothetical protein
MSQWDRAVIRAWASSRGATVRFWRFDDHRCPNAYDVANVLFWNEGGDEIECWQVFRPMDSAGVVALDIACGILGTRYSCLGDALAGISTPEARDRIVGS